jgi:hypothetical protein
MTFHVRTYGTSDMNSHILFITIEGPLYTHSNNFITQQHNSDSENETINLPFVNNPDQDVLLHYLGPYPEQHA